MTHHTITSLFSVETLAHFYFTAQAQFAAPSMSELHSFSLQMQSLDKASAILIAMFIVQALFLLIRTALGELTGPYKLLILSFLAVVVTIGEKYLRGESLFSIFGDASTLMAYQVLIHQLVKHYKEMKHGKKKRKSNYTYNDICYPGDHDSIDSDSRLHPEDTEERPLPFRY